MKNSGSVYIVTGMCCDEEGQESKYPQGSDAKSSSEKFQLVYWRCAVVYFASSVRNNPEAQHILFTNTDRIPNIESFNTVEFFNKIGVKVVQIPFTYQPPIEYYPAFRSTFFKFDIIQYLKNHSESNDLCIALDSDCVWVNSADRIIADIEKHGLTTYDLYEPDDKKISGLTRQEMQKIYEELGYKVDEPPKYFGAEFIVGSGKHIKILSDEVDSIWETCLQRFAAGETKFNTEEQMLSYIYNKLGYARSSGNAYFNRVWTSPIYYTANEGDLKMDVWHLPAEKGYGIKRLFAQVANPNSDFWNVPVGELFIKYVAGYMGIPKRNISKTVLDVLDNRISGIQRRLAKVTGVVKN
ncbi:MAG: hypothetical protein LH628_17885 [Microcoleus sp. CAN_BIN18]|nr:hypothetical protein [Microcoleus sp. CAN_BIN18]